MKVLIRADASVQIGTGHIMRTLVMAQRLSSLGRQVFFICSDLPGNLATYIEQKGFRVFLLPPFEHWMQDAEATKQVILKNFKEESLLLVVDHYGLDFKWEQYLRPYVAQIMVIDDLANRVHDCDRLLDQNFYLNLNERYQGLVPPECQMLLGPKHALLRPEFYRVKETLQRRDGIVRRILVFFGGSDPTNETMKTLEAIAMLQPLEIAVDLVVGASNPNQTAIKDVSSRFDNLVFHCQVENMAELIGRSDLAIGAGGTTALERCFLGLPAIVVTVAANQVETVTALASAGALINLGWWQQVTATKVAQALTDLICKPEQLLSMSAIGLSLFK
ncbi:MAG TPA: UDP-2,4-diacetamido-2,4,6-trideoxy-beta-L-altropyranose hydrolase [Bacillota bacterium]|jgi:UDP-2,4-diacetamido-2,4,6-trideoxy-beta-L-altropyranose hydrolase|nr:UDP-2,4-diacetamido-2,4,6-trideoxy-beta-L-altropyranose hydrolase [Bacillota bacterium]HOL10940.1 UDP-2,4-diacetamido-2,4,6-trideoxy-beta-L-altropyranose hydrolase [Bacillota bacterium]HPO97831.1 UDP-2,4-diacetamido-2,4,6-trideoxy-beta-L-altropyranose hydrolase [Bacillota bacterium]